jgi:hypothetical protein
MRLGIRGSTALARKFEHANALGLTCGRRNRLTVVDVDTPDPNVVADAMSVYGPSPLVAQTPSGGHHIYYRHAGGEDRRRIRAAIWRQRNAPIDVLGNGFVVVPPSRGPKGEYRFVQGALDDIGNLPTIQRPDAAESATSVSEAVPEGQRNNQLFRHCMRSAARASSLDEVLDAARCFNAGCQPQLEEAEVINTAQSSWNYTSKGLNRFGQHGAWFPAEEIVGMLAADQDAFILLALLRAHNGPYSNFMCTNSLRDRLEWDRRRLAAARNRLVALGRLRCVRQAGRGHAALYEWV